MTDRPTRPDLTSVLDRIRRGEAGADDLLPAVYDELHSLASGLLRNREAGQTLQPTSLVHEAYLRLAGTAADSWESRRHFFCVAAKAMRQIIINHAERRRAAKRGAGWHRVTLSAVEDARGQDVDLLALHEALQELERLDPRQCRIVEMRFFAGFSVEQTAEVLGVSPRTVKLDWRMARAWLHDRLAGAQ